MHKFDHRDGRGAGSAFVFVWPTARLQIKVAGAISMALSTTYHACTMLDTFVDQVHLAARRNAVMGLAGRAGACHDLWTQGTLRQGALQKVLQCESPRRAGVSVRMGSAPA